jgi:hypothetical protein
MHDAAAWNGRASFILRAMVIWTIHDFPAYGVVAGCTTKGYRGCPVCGPNTRSKRATALHKNIYDHFRVFLLEGHPLRRDIRNYNTVEEGPPPSHVSGEDVLRYAAMRAAWLAAGNTPMSSDDPVHVTGIKRRPALYDLPYWKVRAPLYHWKLGSDAFRHSLHAVPVLYDVAFFFCQYAELALTCSPSCLLTAVLIDPSYSRRHAHRAEHLLQHVRIPARREGYFAGLGRLGGLRDNAVPTSPTARNGRDVFEAPRAVCAPAAAAHCISQYCRANPSPNRILVPAWIARGGAEGTGPEEP